MSTLNVSVQLLAPGWVQARALGTYQMVFRVDWHLDLSCGALSAERASTPIALTAAAIGMAVVLPFTFRLHVMRGKLPGSDPVPVKNPVPHLELEPEPSDGPLRVLVDYRVKPENYAEFVKGDPQVEGRATALWRNPVGHLSGCERPGEAGRELRNGVVAGVSAFARANDDGGL